MLALRDQENLIHTHHTIAAAKPLNQGLRGLAPKTPCNNGVKSNFAKLTIGGRGDENKAFTVKQANIDKQALETPIAPRERAPLGVKTTNVKAHAFQTPAAPLEPQRTQRRTVSSRKHKLKIHQQSDVFGAEIPIQDVVDEEEPEIEYSPPKITELSDYDDDPYAFGPDKKFPQFEGGNMFRGWFSHFCNPVDENGVSRIEREDRELDERFEKIVDQVLQKHMDEQDAQAEAIMRPRQSKETEIAVKRISNTTSANAGHKQSAARSGPSTLASRSAAVALSSNALSSRPHSSFAAPTAASKAKNTIKQCATTRPLNRQTPGTAASRTTIGYSMGRKVSSALRDIQSVDAERAKPIPELEADVNLLDELLRGSEDIDLADDPIFGELNQKDWFQEMAEQEVVLELPPT